MIYLIRKIFFNTFYILNGFRYQLQIPYYRFLGAKISKGVRFYGRVMIIGYPSNLSIGEQTSLNNGVIISCIDKVFIGKQCHISTNVMIHTAGLNEFDFKHNKKPIKIKNKVWLAAGVVVTQGSEISSNTIIAANSVVKGYISGNSLYAGSPCKFKRKLNKSKP